MDTLESFWAVYSNLVLTLGTNALLALSIYLTLSCGLLAMANAAFMGIGAYAAALLTLELGAPFGVALAASMGLPALVAAAIGRPTLRLSGVYLAMATLAFGEVVRVAILNAEDLTGGALGLNGIPQSTTWWHVLLALAGVLALLARLQRSRVGRAWLAIREDGTAAALMGIDVGAARLGAFVLGAAIAGLAGALEAHLTFFIGPGEFGFERGVEILTMAVLGGIGSLAGPVLGSTLITLLPELLRPLHDFRLVVNGLILVVVTLFLPQGLWDPGRIGRLLRRRGPVAPPPARP